MYTLTFSRLTIKSMTVWGPMPISKLGILGFTLGWPLPAVITEPPVIKLRGYLATLVRTLFAVNWGRKRTFIGF